MPNRRKSKGKQTPSRPGCCMPLMCECSRGVSQLISTLFIAFLVHYFIGWDKIYDWFATNLVSFIKTVFCWVFNARFCQEDVTPTNTSPATTTMSTSPTNVTNISTN